MEEKKAAGHSGGYYIGYRLREECSICGEQGRQKDKPGEEHKFPESRAEECQLHFAESSDLIYQWILYGQRDDHKGEPLNISDGTVQNLRIFCEEPYIDRRCGPGHNSNQNTEGNTQSGDVQNRFFDSLSITFSIVKADHRLAAEGDATHRHGDEQKITLYNQDAQASVC